MQTRVLGILLMTFTALPLAQGQNAKGLGGKLGSEVESSVLQQLKPYFPKAKTKLDKSGNLIIITCLRNVGPSMLTKLQPVIENQFYSTGLLNKLGLAMSGAKRVDVGFERDILVFDLSTRRDAWLPGDRVTGYVDAYETACQ